jgi:carbon-monoxide dehydrogenase medium subunit
LNDFDYVAVKTVPEAVKALAGQGARVLAGGTDLIVQLRSGKAHASLLVDIKAIPELNVVEFSPQSGLVIGAAVPCFRLCREPALAAHYPGLLDAVSLIGGVQIQGRATLGGNLCNASPAADSIPALIVHRATCRIAGPGGGREVPVEQFCLAPGKTVLQPGEFLVSLHLPAPEKGFGAAYLRFIPRSEMDIAVTGAAAALWLETTADRPEIDDQRVIYDHLRIVSARAALAAVAPTPLDVPEVSEYLKGKPASPENLARAAQIAQAAVQPISDMRGTFEQRRHLVRVLVRRALETAFERARA